MGGRQGHTSRSLDTRSSLSFCGDGQGPPGGSMGEVAMRRYREATPQPQSRRGATEQTFPVGGPTA